jgi:hypothetical protein
MRRDLADICDMAEDSIGSGDPEDFQALHDLVDRVRALFGIRKAKD